MRKFRSLGVLAASAAVCSLATVTVASASTSVPARKLTPLQQGLKFYQGKTVTFVSPDAPGGGYDTWARTLAPYLGQYLHAEVNIENIPAGATFPGQDLTAHSNANGLTVGWLNTLGDISAIVTNAPALNFNPERVAFIGATAPSTTVWLGSTNAGACPAQNWDDLVRLATPANQVSQLTVTSGTTFTIGVLANAAFGISARLIKAYSNSQAVGQGFLRGDGCIALQSLSSAGPLLAGNKAVALAFSSAPSSANPFAKYLPATRAIAKIAGKSKPSTPRERVAMKAFLALVGADNRILFAPSQTPAAEVAALRYAMQKAMNNPNLQTQAVAVGNNPGFVSGFTEKQNYIHALDATEHVKSIIGG